MATLTALSYTGTFAAANPQALRVSYNGAVIAVGHAVSPYVQVWRRSGASFVPVVVNTRPAVAIGEVALSADGALLVATGDQNGQTYIWSWNTGTGQYDRVWSGATLAGYQRGMDVNPAGDRIAIGNGSGALTLYSWNGTTLTALQSRTGFGFIDSVRFSNSGALLAIGTRWSTNQIFNITETSPHLSTSVWSSASLGVWGAQFSPDDSLLFSGRYYSGAGLYYAALNGASSTANTLNATPTCVGVAPAARDFIVYPLFSPGGVQVYDFSGASPALITTPAPMAADTSGQSMAVSDAKNGIIVLTFTSTAMMKIYEYSDGSISATAVVSGFLPQSAASVEIPVEVGVAALGRLGSSSSDVFIPIGATADWNGFLPKSQAVVAVVPADDTGEAEVIRARPAVISVEADGVSFEDSASGAFAYSLARGVLPTSDATVLFPITVTGSAVGVLSGSSALVYQDVHVNAAAVGLLGASEAGVDVSALEATGAAIGLLAQSAGDITLNYKVTATAGGLLPRAEALVASPVFADIEATGLLPVSAAEAGQVNEVSVAAVGVLPMSESAATQPVLADLAVSGLLPSSSALVDVYNVEADVEATGLLGQTDAFVAVPYRVEIEATGPLPASAATVKIVSGVMVDAVGRLGQSSSILARAYRIDSNNRGFRPRSLAIVGTPVRINGAAVGLRPIPAGLLKLRYESGIEAVGLLARSAAEVRVFNRVDSDAAGLLPASVAEIMLRNVVEIASTGLLPTVDVTAKTRYLVTVAAVGLLGRSASESEAEERLYAAAPVFAEGGALSIGGGVFFGFGKKLTTG